MTDAAAPEASASGGAFARNTAWTLIGRVGMMPATLLTSLLSARLLSSTEFGWYRAAMSWPQFLSMVGLLGLSAALMFRIRRKQIAPAKALGTTLALLGGSSVVILVGMALFAGSLREAMADPPWVLVALSAGQMLVAMATVTTLALAMAVDRFQLHAALTLTRAWGSVAVVGGLFLFAWSDVIVLYAFGLGWQLVAVVVVLGWLLRVTGGLRWPDLGEATEQLRFGFKSYLFALTDGLHQHVDIALLGLLTTATDVGHYGLAAAVVFRMAAAGPSAVTQALFPQLAGLSPAESARFSARIFGLLLPTVAAMCAVGMLVSPLAVPWLWGAPFTASVLPILILFPAMGLLALFRVFANYYTANDRHLVVIVLQLGSVVLNIALNLLWIPTMGIAGAAWASLASCGAEAVGILAVFAWQTRLPPGAYLPRRHDVDLVLSKVARRFGRRAPRSESK